MRKIFIAVFSIFLGVESFSQDVQFSQFYANPLYLNPAFAGSTNQTRIGLSFRNQWPALDQSFLAFSVYGDHYFDQINSGLGILITGTKDSFTQSQQTEIGLNYSYRLRLGEDRFFQFGAQGGLMKRDGLFDGVILGDQLDIDRGVIIGEPGDGFEGESQLTAADLHVGGLYLSPKFWLGLGVFHLLEPPISYLDVEANQLPMKYAVHGGYRWSLAPGNINDYFNNTDQERSFALAFNYKRQGEFSQLDLGGEFFFEPLVLGLWYRGLPTKYELPNSESLICLVGLVLESGLELGYSFDFSISKLGQSVTGGSHELTIRYIFSTKSPKKQYLDPLPTFRF